MWVIFQCLRSHTLLPSDERTQQARSSALVLLEWWGRPRKELLPEGAGHWDTYLKVIPGLSSLFLSASSAAWWFLLQTSDNIDQNRFISVEIDDDKYCVMVAFSCHCSEGNSEVVSQYINFYYLQHIVFKMFRLVTKKKKSHIAEGFAFNGIRDKFSDP